MFLHKIEGSWLTNPFWRNEFLLDSPDHIGKLRQSAVQSIWIDLSRGLDVEVAQAGGAASAMGPSVSAGRESSAESEAFVQDPLDAAAGVGPASAPGQADDPAAQRARTVHGFDPRAPRDPAKPGPGFDPRAPRDPAKAGPGFDPRAPRDPAAGWGFDPRAPRDPAKPGPGFDPRAPRDPARPGPGFDPREPRAAAAAVAPAAEAAGPALRAVSAPRREPTVPLASELQRAGAIVRDVRGLVGGLYEKARLGQALDAERCLPLVDAVNESVNRNPDALLTLTRLRKRDEYTYMHSVAVCALMVALGREMGLDEDTCREAGLAGLLHDLGKAKMPEGILAKPGKLTQEEFSIIRTHPRRGYELLAEARGATDRVIDVTLHHHERIDGTGYPDQLPRAKISLFSRMGAVCDVYDAITSHRAYKARWDPAESIERMESWRGHFDDDILQSFVKTVGIFPIGAIVRLQSQRVAIVFEQNVGAYTKPIVQVFYSLKSQMPIPVQRLDLSSPRCQDRIVSREPTENWASLDVDGLLKAGLSITAV
jgi:putative nucleotidyltransferase with HDIG domain